MTRHKTRNVRIRKLNRYLDYLCALPGDNVAPPCIERAYNYQATKHWARSRIRY